MKSMKKNTPKTKSLALSNNAVYYAVLSFFIFGALLGLLAIIESKKALDCAGSDFEKQRAKKVLWLSIVGISAPAIGFIMSLLDFAISLGEVAYGSWLILIGSLIGKM